MEPHWRRLRYLYGDQIRGRYFMGGMLPDWQSYSDPLNAVHSPGQMGPQWFYVRKETGRPLDERLWVEDPPASSYPACLAVKAAGLQGPAAEEAYLRRLREASMLERRNPAHPEMLVELAHECAASETGAGCLDPERFEADLGGEAAIRLFEEDLREARFRQIGRFPTFIIRSATRGPEKKAVLLTGYRPFEVLAAAVAHVAPGIQPQRGIPSPEEYRQYWGSVLPDELETCAAA